MSIRFRNAPLAELLVELRWNVRSIPFQAPPGTVLPAGIQLPVDPSTVAQHEELFKKFGGRIGIDGYTSSERVVPIGFPTMTYQPIYRYRNPNQDQSTLYQIGNGVFTANATPPYKSWQEFSPIVGKGISALLDCLDDENKQQISLASLRYIDSFTEAFQAGIPIWDFVTEVLGVKISLPGKLKEYCIDEKKIKPTLQFSIPVNIGTLNIVIAEGHVNNVPSYLLDSTVVIPKEKGIAPDKDVLMLLLNSARDIIHYSFVDMTKSLKNIMQPIDG